MKREVIVAVVCLVASAIIYSTAGSIEEERAATFPSVIIVGIMVLSGLLIAQSIFIRKPEVDTEKQKYPWPRFILLLCMIVIYLAVAEPLGFYLSAFIFFVTVCFILGWTDLTVGRGAVWVVGSAAFTGVLFLLFKVLLEVQTPRGILF